MRLEVPRVRFLTSCTFSNLAGSCRPRKGSGGMQAVDFAARVGLLRRAVGVVDRHVRLSPGLVGRHGAHVAHEFLAGDGLDSGGQVGPSSL